MSDKCIECGAVIPPDSPGGYCGQCLLRLGLETAAEPPDAPAAGQGAAPVIPLAGTKVQYFGDYELLEEGLSPNERLLLFRRENKTVVLDLEQMREVVDLGETLQQHLFTPDSKHLIATDSADTSIRLWDVDTWKVSSILSGHRHKVLSLAISLDGRILASGSDDTTVRLWDMKTKTRRPAPNPILQGNSGAVNAVALSPDGKTLAAGSFNGPIKLWSVPGRQEFGSVPRRTFIGCVRLV